MQSLRFIKISACTALACAASAFAQPANDNCANASAASLGSISVDNTGATTDGSASCGFGGDTGGADIWYTFTSTAAGPYRFDTCGGTLDTIVSVLDACAGTELGCDDDTCGFAAGSQVTVQMAANQAVKVRVSGFNVANPAQGPTTLTISQLVPPPNDLCANAQLVAAGSTAFDNSGAGSEAAASCGTGGDPGSADIWFRYTPSSTGFYSVDTCGSGFDTIVSLYDSCGGTELVCNDDGCSGTLQSKAIAQLTGGTPVVIRVAGWQGAEGSGVLTIGSFVPDANDFCATATPVSLGLTAFDTSNASNDGPITCGLGENDLWYRFTSASGGNFAFESCGSAYDTVLALFDSCGGTELACNDDFCGLQSRVTSVLTPGQSVLVRVAGFVGQVGSGTLTISALVPPVNDNCAGAIAAVLGTNNFDTTAATTDGSASCGFGGDPGTLDVWYTFSPATSGDYSIRTCGSVGYDSILSVLDSCGGTEIACNDDACGLQSSLIANLTANTTYRIRISGYLGDVTNTGILTIGLPSGNDLCTSPSVAVPGTTYTFDTSAATTDALPTGAGCVGNASPSIYYRYTAGGTGSATIDLCGSSFDTAITVFATCADTTAISCNDDFCGLQSQLTYGITQGTSYLIRISGFGGGAGAGQMIITETTGGGCVPGYLASTSASEFEDIAGTGTQQPLTDDSSVVVPIGFSFTFYGTAYTNVGVGSNGFLQFDVGSADLSNDPIPSTNTPNNLACGMWDDLNPGAGGAVYTLTRGAAPNRQFIASYQGVPQFANTDSNTFQIVLNENGTIEYRYGAITPDVGGDYSVGVENATGLVGTAIVSTSLGSGNTARLLTVTVCSECDDIDFNNDGVFPDSQDLTDYLSVLGGGPCSTDPTPGCNSIDFNRDGVFPDSNDTEAFLRVFGGGAC